MITFTSRMLALQWAASAPKQGRLYILTFQPFFKVGSSQDFRNRFYELLAFRSRSLGTAFESAVVGSPHAIFRSLEKQLHAALTSFRSNLRPGYREWYRRDHDVEAAILSWVNSGYALDQFVIIEGLALLEESRKEQTCTSQQNK